MKKIVIPFRIVSSRYCSGKTFKVMKLTYFLLLVTALNVLANDTYSQYGRVSLNIHDSPISMVLSQIEDQTDFFFLYSSKMIDVTREVDIRAENVMLPEVLNELFVNTDIRYVVKDKQILLMNEDFAPGPGQQDRQITGRVVGGDDLPLPGVSVVVKGTMVGVITDSDGTFTLSVPPGGTILQFSFVGMDPKEVEIGSQTVFNIQMKEAELGLDEVVVIGYGTVKKRDITGSVMSIKAEELQTGVQTSMNQMIQGRSPGVQVTTVSGEPGGAMFMRIRGPNSITASNEPLYVIDGLPVGNNSYPGSSLQDGTKSRNPLNALNTADIESIEILKDASATAIYGSRGANGVILITTKKGQGKMKVDYSTYFGMQQPAKLLDYLNGEEYMAFINGILVDQGSAPKYTQAEIDAVGEGTNWQSEVLRKAPVVSHQLSFSGSSGNTKYYSSFGYLNQEGIVISSGIKQYTARVNLYHSMDKFTFGINLNTSLVLDDYVNVGAGYNSGAGVITTSREYDPTLPVTDADGNYTINYAVDLDNPVAIANTWLDDANTNRTFGSFNVDYELFTGLKARINLGADRQSSRRDEYLTIDTKRGMNTNGYAHISEQDLSTYLAEFTLNYDRTIKEVHHLTALAGTTYQQFNGRSVGATSTNFPSDAYLTNNLGAGDVSQQRVGSNRYQNQLLSYIGRVNYSLFDKYMLTATFRADGSSRFGEGNKFGYFPSMALAWRLSDEPFLSRFKVLSDLKLRVSYGSTGNQEIGNYNSLMLLGVVGRAVFDDNTYVGIAPDQMANPNLKWETTRQMDVGLDFSLLKDRISGSLDYFIKNTSDLLYNLPIPPSSGFTTSLQNVGDIRNSGFEFAITSRNLTGEFSWSTTLIGSTIKNTVTNLGDLGEIYQGGFAFAYDVSILKEGYPMNSYYGYVVEGIFQSEEEIAGSAQPTAKPGDLRFKDIDKSGSITIADRTILGDPFPDFSFGLNNAFSYKGFDLEIFFEGMVGNELLNGDIKASETPIELVRNRLSYVQDRWTTDNKDSENPSFVNTNNTYASNSRLIEDASFLRLKNLKLSYTIPWDKVRLLDVFVMGQNLFTLTKYRGYDPDVSSLGDSQIRIDYGAYPRARIYTIGINVGF
jgi:TonB-linked SusC/RagA family outer membrane protein